MSTIKFCLYRIYLKPKNRGQEPRENLKSYLLIYYVHLGNLSFSLVELAQNHAGATFAASVQLQQLMFQRDAFQEEAAGAKSYLGADIP